MNLQRGALPSSRHSLAAAEPHKIDTTVPIPINFIRVPKKLSMWGNDEFGDCVTAEEAFAKSTQTPELFISEAKVISWAKENGYLNGAEIVEVVKRMQVRGFVQDSEFCNDGSPISVDWTNETILRSAIYTGPVKIGIAANQLQSTIDKIENFPINGWVGTGYTKDNSEDHCISICGYGNLLWLASQLKTILPTNVGPDTKGYAVFTWSSIGIIDRASMLAITHEAWLRNPTTIILPMINLLK